MHRWLGAPDWPALVTLQQRPSDYTAPPTDRPLSTSMQGDLAKCLHFYHWNNETIRTVGLFSVFLSFFHRRILRFKKKKQKNKNEEAAGKFGQFHRLFCGNGTLNSNGTATTNANNDTVLCWTTITKLSVLATSSPRLGEEARETYVANSLLFLRWSSWRVFLRVRVLCSVCFIYTKRKKRKTKLSLSGHGWWTCKLRAPWRRAVVYLEKQKITLLCFSKKQKKERKRKTNCGCYKFKNLLCVCYGQRIYIYI